MPPGAFEMLLALFLFISGGNTNRDALDILSTDAYWKAKGVAVTVDQLQVDADGGPKLTDDLPVLVKALGAADFSAREDARKKLQEIGAPALPLLRTAASSPDAETAATAQALIAAISLHGKEPDIRRLMAIRTLGERKEKAALPTLQPLTDSKLPFVADYARRALAQINNTPLKPIDHHPDLLPDLALLPADTGMLGQTVGLGSDISVDSLVALTLANVKPDQLPLFGPAGERQSLPTKDALVERLNRELVDLLEQIGNVRADGMTLGLSSDIGGDRNWIVMSFHGQYDRSQVRNFFKQVAGIGPPDDRMIAYKVGDIDALKIGREATFLMPSDQQLIFILVEERKVPAESIIVPVATALATGKSSVDPKIDALVKAADKSGPAWAVGVPSPQSKRMLSIDFVETFVGTAKETAEGIALQIIAKGDPADAAKATNEITTDITGLIPNIERDIGRTGAKDVQPVIDFFKSMKFTPTDTGATATAILPKTIGNAFLAALSRDFMYSLMRPPTPRPNMPQDMPMPPQRPLP